MRTKTHVAGTTTTWIMGISRLKTAGNVWRPMPGHVKIISTKVSVPKRR